MSESDEQGRDLHQRNATLEQENADLRIRIDTATAEAEYLYRALSQRDSTIAAVTAERDALEQQLRTIRSSTVWRATRPLRRLLDRFPGSRRLVRRGLKLLWWGLTLRLGAKLRDRRQTLKEFEACTFGDAASAPASVETVRKPPGWYGRDPLRSDQLSGLGTTSNPGPGIYEKQTAAISQRYHHVVHDDGSADFLRLTGSAATARNHLQAVTVPDHVEASGAPPRYTIVTPFYHHLEFFRICAESVAAMAIAAKATGPEERVEWIVVNDDPTVSEETLRALIPRPLLGQTLIVSDGRNLGIVARLNQGIAAARYPWILFLDCDDEIAPETAPVLDHYIGLFPRCRYIASTMIDIDEQGEMLRPRHHEHPATDLFEYGMVASHLKAVRRDLIGELGGLDPHFSGVQDYDLALRAAAREPLLQIPEHLYRYRWHGQSQTVARQERQAQLARAARARFLREVMALCSASEGAHGRSVG